MKIINETEFPFAALPGRFFYPGHSLTAIVKGTFMLRPGEPLVPAADQPFPGASEPYPDDEEGVGPPRYPMDFAFYKPRTDLLVVGSCHTPDGNPATSCDVRFQAGSFQRTLRVTGQRRARQGLLRLKTTAPEPFSRMPLRYEHAFGGPGHGPNPIGKGGGEYARISRHRDIELPTIVDPEVQRPDAGSEPAGFAPLSERWEGHQRLLGTYGDDYVDTRWPWFPEDFDWGYFNAAPRRMQFDGYLTGNEPLRFTHLHPVEPVYTSSLPGIRLRCFLNTRNGAFTEIPMRLDTLWADMDAELVVLVWRGVARVESQELDEVDHVYIISEPLDRPPTDPEICREQLYRRLTPAEAEPPPPMPEPLADSEEDERVLALLEEEGREKLREAGIDPDGPPPPLTEEERQLAAEYGLDEAEEEPWTRERFTDAFASGRTFENEDLRGLDLSHLNLDGVLLDGALLAEINFTGSSLEGASFKGAGMSAARLAGIRAKGACFEGCDLTGAVLATADLHGARFAGATLDQAGLANANLEETDFHQASLVGADLTGIRACRAGFADANLSETRLDAADLREAVLERATVSEAVGSGADLSGACCTELRAGNGLVLVNAVLVDVSAVDAVWEGADLHGSDFSYASMAGADLTRVSLAGACLYAVDMPNARLEKADLSSADCRCVNLFQGSLEGADATDADFRGSNLYGVEFLDAVLVNTRFHDANLRMTKLDRR